LQLGEPLAGLQEALAGLVVGGQQRVPQFSPGGGRLHGGIGGLAGHGQDGALDGLEDGLVGVLGALDEGLGHLARIGPAEAVEGHGPALQVLGHDGARVARRPRAGAVVGRQRDLLQGRCGALLDGSEGRLQRGEHVVARVAVGHGVHIDLIQEFASGAQIAHRLSERRAQHFAVEGVGIVHPISSTLGHAIDSTDGQNTAAARAMQAPARFTGGSGRGARRGMVAVRAAPRTMGGRQAPRWLAGGQGTARRASPR